MKIINCTPHPIMIRQSKPKDKVFSPCGILPRVSTVIEEAGDVNGIPCVSQTQGDVEGLPDPQTGTIYIVSAIVLNASDRTDLVAPDTGKTCIRDESGRIRAVTRFIIKKVNCENSTRSI